MKKVLVMLVIIAIFGFCFNSCSESQYEKDFYSAQDKTWDEMTPGEKKVTEDYIDWAIKQSEEDGADWGN